MTDLEKFFLMIFFRTCSEITVFLNNQRSSSLIRSQTHLCLNDRGEPPPIGPPPHPRLLIHDRNYVRCNM